MPNMRTTWATSDDGRTATCDLCGDVVNLPYEANCPRCQRVYNAIGADFFPWLADVLTIREAALTAAFQSKLDDVRDSLRAHAGGNHPDFNLY